jgi:hypothetical protein
LGKLAAKSEKKASEKKEEPEIKLQLVFPEDDIVA